MHAEIASVASRQTPFLLIPMSPSLDTTLLRGYQGLASARKRPGIWAISKESTGMHIFSSFPAGHLLPISVLPNLEIWLLEARQRGFQWALTGPFPLALGSHLMIT